MEINGNHSATRFSALADRGWSMIRARETKISGFKVFGERASGTNFVEFLLERNSSTSHVPQMKYGWKHGFPSFIAVARSDLIVVTFRDPFDWVRSLYAKPWCSHESMHALSFSAFIRAEWNATVQKPRNWFQLRPPSEFAGLPLQMDRDAITGQPFCNIMKMRSMKSAAWLGLANRQLNVVLARYEAVAASPGMFLEDLSSSFDIEVEPKLTLPKERLGGGYDMVDVEARRAEASQISEADLSYIREQLDLEQENRLGYQIG